MALPLDKGATLNLTKAAEDAGSNLDDVSVAGGWDIGTDDNGQPLEFDVDVSVVLTDDAGKALSEKHLVYYNQKEILGGLVSHSGDNRTGAGDGDDETVTVKLSQLDASVKKVVVLATIHDAKGASFSKVDNLYVRIVNNGDGTELGRYELGKAELAGTDAGIVAELVRSGSGWDFAANSKALSGSLAGSLAEFGLA